MNTVAIAGVGLIGGSFALALRKAGFSGAILGVSSPRTLERALAAGAIDRGATLEEAAAEADLVFLAQPISTILDTLDKLDTHLRPAALVTDAGSTKAAICARGAAAIRRGRFLGGHPMAGKEVRGVDAADPGLFQGRTWFLCPARPEDLEHPFIDWLRRIGAVPVSVTPADHDALVALTSHLPQLASTALAAALASRLGPERAAGASGPGLAGMTRLARGSWDIWRDILDTNTGPIDQALGLYIDQLVEIRRALASGEVEPLFQAGAGFAGRLPRPG